jgi:hypothetical protein
MNYVFLSPHFPPQYRLFCKALKDRGADVLGVGDSPHHELPHDLKGWLTDYVHVPHLAQRHDAVRALGYLTWRHGKLDRIDSLNEHWLELEAQLRDDFNLEGPRLAETVRRRSKTGMKDVFRRAGVPVPEGEAVTSAQQVRAFVQKHGLPIVIKPDTGVGAAGAFKVSTNEELERALERPHVGAIVEKFIDGRIVSFDGITDRNGEIVFFLSHVYSAGIMEIVTRELDIHYYARRDVPPLLESLGRKAVRAFELRERFFHFEFFEQKDGTYRALEGNFRPPGGFTTDMMNYACDIDIYDLWARIVTGDDVSRFRYQRHHFCAHVVRRNKRAYRYSNSEVEKRLGTALIVSREMPPVFSGAMGDWMYLLRTRDEKVLQEHIALIEEPA